MKKFFLFAAMAGVALTGCVKTESEVAVKSDSNRIVFDNPVVSSVTRALIDGTEYPTDVPFSVYAQYKNGNTGENLLYMDNVTTEYSATSPSTTGKSSWVPVGNYYWPKEGTLSFAAYSPTAADTDDVFASVSWADDSGFIFDNFNAVTNQANSYDLMYSDYVPNQTQANEQDYKYYGIQLTFKHALSALVFRAQAADNYTGAEIKVTKIEVLEAYNQGDLTTNNASNSAGWSDFQNPATMEVQNLASAALTTDYVQQGDVLLMVPQGFVHNGGVKVKITYTIKTESAATMTQTHTVALSTLNEAGAGASTHDDWEMGKRYIYDITIGLDRIYFAPTVIDWDDVTVTGKIE